MKNSKTFEGKAKPLGAYPHLKRAGNFVFISGTSSRRKNNSIAGMEIVDGKKIYDIPKQTRAVLENIQDYLAEIGATLEDVVDVTTFLVNIDDFSGYNEVYGEFFAATSGPARTTIAAHQLPHPDLKIEIKAMAYCPQN